MLTLVGVYGSLRRGFGNHVLIGQEPLDTIQLELPFYMVSLGAFPALVPSTSKHLITVELYEVDDRVFSNLDMLEGYPDFYTRTQFSTPHGDAWIYHFQDGGAYHSTIVESGDWDEFCGDPSGV